MPGEESQYQNKKKLKKWSGGVKKAVFGALWVAAALSGRRFGPAGLAESKPGRRIADFLINFHLYPPRIIYIDVMLMVFV
jgi:hypothetical protein